MSNLSDPYLPGHLHDRLLCDDRIGEQDLRVDVVAGVVVITGEVTTEERRVAVSEVAAEVLGDVGLRNQVRVVRADGPVETEHLP